MIIVVVIIVVLVVVVLIVVVVIVVEASLSVIFRIFVLVALLSAARSKSIKNSAKASFLMAVSGTALAKSRKKFKYTLYLATLHCFKWSLQIYTLLHKFSLFLLFIAEPTVLRCIVHIWIFLRHYAKLIQIKLCVGKWMERYLKFLRGEAKAGPKTAIGNEAFAEIPNRIEAGWGERRVEYKICKYTLHLPLYIVSYKKSQICILQYQFKYTRYLPIINCIFIQHSSI